MIKTKSMTNKKILVRITQKVLDEQTRYPGNAEVAEVLRNVMAEVSGIGGELGLYYIEDLEPGSIDREERFIERMKAQRALR